MDAIERYELLGRYLDAVGRQLPRRTRADVARELRETLLSQVEDQELRLGRALASDEIAAILSRYGRPDVVAHSYGARRVLIGPEVFPAYAFAVKLTLYVLAIPTALSVVLAAASADGPIAWQVGRVLWQWVQIAALNLAGVTIVFAWSERRFQHQAQNQSWDPRDLLETSATFARAQRPVPRADAVGALVGMAGMLLWWLGANALLWRWFGWSPLPVEWSPIWTDLTPAAVSVLSAAMAREIVVIVRPRLTRFYLAAGVALNVAAALVVITLLRAGSLVLATASAPAGATIAWLLHGMIVLSLTMILAVAAADTAMKLRGVRRLMRARGAVAA